MSTWVARSRAFLSETVSEVKKATFPAKDELISTTIVVLVTSAIFAVFLWVADIGINWVMSGVFGR
ncbi:MAG: preprotein translocase subunit SecE [Deltaproteobacteria bacterium]|nr:preprotein translocase subunit SecE [Deltaproteobacteria bacterium]